MLSSLETSPHAHVKPRIENPSGYPDRFPVPAGRVSWQVEYPEYHPPVFVADAVRTERREKGDSGWADPNPYQMSTEERRSFVRSVLARMKGYGESFVYDQETGLPLNPRGRSGIRGQGLLGRIGENTAADPMLFRVHAGRLEVLLIKRKSLSGNGQWALPGGMVEPGDTVSQTLLKECIEETLAAKKTLSLQEKQDAIEKLRQMLDFDTKGTEVYRGYVDDPRNTDNAWIVTNACMRLLDSNELEAIRTNFGEFRAGDDAAQVAWKTVDQSLLDTLYASHAELITLAIESLEGSSDK